MDQPMDDDFFGSKTDATAWNDTRDAEWSKMSDEFTNTGYREGITAGKEAAVQSGFDTGFAEVGVPLGRYIGVLRGHASTILSFLLSASSEGSSPEAAVQEARDITRLLNEVRYSDIEPRDEEAERHAREHLPDEADQVMEDAVSEEIQEKRKMEKLEDMLAGISTSGNSAPANRPRPTMENVEQLKNRLWTLFGQLGLPLPDIEPWRL